MAWNDTSATQHKGAYISFNDIRLRGVADVSSFTVVGSVPQIDITSQEDTSRTYLPGLPDAGSWSMTARIELFSPVYNALQESANNGSVHSLRLVYGARAANSKYTDGSSFKIATGITVTNAFASGTHKATVAAAAAAGLPAIAEGAYIAKTAVAPVAGTTAYQITEITAGTNGSVVFTTNASSDPSSALGTSVDFIKPATEAVAQAYVSEFSHSAAVDGVVETNLTFQISGTPVRTVGTPNITIS